MVWRNFWEVNFTVLLVLFFRRYFQIKTIFLRRCSTTRLHLPTRALSKTFYLRWPIELFALAYSYLFTFLPSRWVPQAFVVAQITPRIHSNLLRRRLAHSTLWSRWTQLGAYCQFPTLHSRVRLLVWPNREAANFRSFILPPRRTIFGDHYSRYSTFQVESAAVSERPLCSQLLSQPRAEIRWPIYWVLRKLE